MQFSEFASTLQQLETISSRNEITVILAELFQRLDQDETKPALYLLQGRVAPTYAPIEFGMSDKMLLRAVQAVADQHQVDFVAESKLKEFGDIGIVCETLLHEIKSSLSSIEIDLAFARLLKITQASGAGSQQTKVDIFVDLLKQLDPLSARYVARVVVGKLRLGLSDKTIFDALSWTIDGTKKHRTVIEQAYGYQSDIGTIAELVLTLAKQSDATAAQLTQALAHIKLAVGTPVASKLCEREDSPASVYERLGNCIVQPKLDGMRAQIHWDNRAKITAIFSRNQESLTEAFPDIVATLTLLACQSCIIDSEVVGYDYESDSYLSYHETMTRRRKHDVDAAASSIPLRAMAFDILYLDGVDLTQLPTSERVIKLAQLLQNSNTGNHSGEKLKIAMLDTITVQNEAELASYFTTQIMQGLEGVLCKLATATYAPGTRNFDWIKLKANTQTEMVDTLDVVVIGYYAGGGERAKYGFGSLLTAIYDPVNDQYNSVAKVGSGFTDAQAPQIRADLEALRIDAQPENITVTNSLKPDYWVKPQIVIEVIADEITRSPAHTAAQGQLASFEVPAKVANKGLSLRFPRLKVWNRDKRPDQATDTNELVRLYEIRKQRILNSANSTTR
jgi:DNA ligase-1